MRETSGEHSVYQFFPNGCYEKVVEWVDPETAVKTAKALTESVGAGCGLVVRVIITDGLDCTNFEWEAGKGVTYPPQNSEGRFVGD